MSASLFSLKRINGLMRKEFAIIFRDRGTIAMLIILPILLLIIFGFAIRLDPKNLPTTVISYDNTPLTRSFLSNLQASGYFHIKSTTENEQQATQSLLSSKTSFVITIPANFTRNFVRGEDPQILVELDGTDPGSSASASNVIQPILNQAIEEFISRGLNNQSPSVGRHADIVIHRKFNESNRSEYNIVPGLIGVLLTLTLVMLTSSAITSETAAGTMEMLLTTPLKPIEIIIGKVLPYIVLGYLQLTSILIFGKLLINIPFEGSIWLLYLATAPFIIANLMIGMIFSTIAKTPMQAMQLSIFFQLPSMFLTGYVFSFYGMPKWAQIIGSCLPMTYFMRITRGIMLKANKFIDIVPNVWPILVIALILMIITSKIFRKTLD